MHMDEQKSKNAEPLDADLDRTLDAALAKYATVEPRAGLEGRILANLRAERSRAPERSWWAWGLAAAAAAVFVVAIVLALRPGKALKPVIADHHSVPVQPAGKPEQPSAREEHAAVTLHKPSHQRRSRPQTSESQVVAARVPKLDQFPSPRPLTEQEKLALEYVQSSPEQAALIARAQVAEAREQELERSAAEPGAEPPSSIEKIR